MSENTIFQGVSAPQPITAQPIPQVPVQGIPREIPVSGSPPPIASQNVTPQAVTTGIPIQPPLAGTPPPPLPPASRGGSFASRLPLGKLMKVVVGIVILISIVFLIFGFIIPTFFSNKDEKISLTYWGLWEDPKIMQSVIDGFEKEHPNIDITYEQQEVKQYKDKLETRIQNGTGPDLFRFHNTWVPEIGDSLAPLPSEVITPDQLNEKYYPVIRNDLTQNGAVYGIPIQIDTLALFTNTEMFEAASLQPPTNWEDFGKDARILTVKDEEGKIQTSGAALGTYDNITHAPDILSLLFLQNGADIYDLAKTPQAASDTLAYYTEYATGDSNVWDDSLDPSLLAFSKGNLAMYFGYSWDIFTIHALNPELRFQVSPVPHLPLGRKLTVASYWVEGVSQKSKHQKEAMLFMKYLTEKETLEKMYALASKTRPFGQLYPRSDMAASLKDNPEVYPFVSQAKDAVSSFFASDTYDNGLNEKSNTYLGNAVRSMLDDTSPESALETLSAGVAQVLQKYGQQ